MFFLLSQEILVDFLCDLEALNLSLMWSLLKVITKPFLLLFISSWGCNCKFLLLAYHILRPLLFVFEITLV